MHEYRAKEMVRMHCICPSINGEQLYNSTRAMDLYKFASAAYSAVHMIIT